MRSIILMAALATSLAACGSPRPRMTFPQSAEDLPGQLPKTVRSADRSADVTLDAWTWRYDGTMARGTFTISNHGVDPVGFMTLRCAIHSVRLPMGQSIPMTVMIGGSSTPVAPGKTRTFDPVWMPSVHNPNDVTITCDAFTLHASEASR